MTAIGGSLRAARQAAGMSQATVANALYITRQTVSRWEQDKTLPNIYALQDLGKLYGCDLATLIDSSLPHTQEVAKMAKKINWMSLFGMIWFNIIVGLGVAGIVLGLLLTVWGVVVSFILSPLLLLVFQWFVTPVAHFWVQLPISILMCGVGLALWQPATALTSYTWEMIRHYVRYNLRSIYA